MSAKDSEIPKITSSNTKKEMLEVYNILIEKIKEKERAELKPEKAQKSLKEKGIVQTADEIEKKGVIKKLYDLKEDIGRTLGDLASKLGAEEERYKKVKEAIEVKNNELKEIFEIEKSAFALAALLEAQKQKNTEFEEEIAQQKQALDDKIDTTKIQWEKEKNQYEERIKEQKIESEKRRIREKEEYEYSYNREKELKTRQLKDEIETLEKELRAKKENFEKEVDEKENDLLQRDVAVSEREKTLDDLQKQVNNFPQQLESSILKAEKEAIEKVKNEAKKNEALLIKGFEGEKNVLITKIESLETFVATQQKQIETLSSQIDDAYGKVQNIAIKAVSTPPSHSVVHTSMEKKSD